MYLQEANDVVISTRVRSTTLATVARFFAQKGRQLESKSSVIRLVLEEFEGVLVGNKLAERVTHIWDAREILEKLGLDNLNPGDRNKKNYMEELQRAEYVHEGYDLSELGAPKTKEQMVKLDAELREVAIQTAAELEGVEPKIVRDRVTKHKERDKAERDALADVDGIAVTAHENEWPGDETVNDTEHK